MTTIAEDALKAVPDSYRQAAIALGATRWQIVHRVLLPAARNGLLAAVLLGVGRAVGETMAVLMASGHSINLPTSIFDSVWPLKNSPNRIALLQPSSLAVSAWRRVGTRLKRLASKMLR